jgi:hypothetical protein
MMADPKLDRAPLDAYLRRQVTVDVEMRKVLRAAIRSLDTEIERLSRSAKIGNQVRASQLRLTREMMSVWRSVGDVIETGITGSAADIAKVQQAFDKDMMKKLGAKMSPDFARSQLAQAQAGLESYISRRHFSMTLSERVYKNGKRSVASVEQIINQGLLSGRSAAEIARMVRGFINPRTPGGLSYAAMRLARTELNNAFHQTSIRMAKDDPFVERMRWNLSGSHPKPDVCNQLASAVNKSGWGPGEYSVDQVPGKPHPQCLCFTTTIPISEEAFLRNMSAGKYDNMAELAA